MVEADQLGLVTAVEALLDQRVAQGLPRRITDPATLARVAALIRESGLLPAISSHNKKAASASSPAAQEVGADAVVTRVLVRGR